MIDIVVTVVASVLLVIGLVTYHDRTMQPLSPQVHLPEPDYAKQAMLEWQLGIRNAAGELVQPTCPELYSDEEINQIAIERVKYTQLGIVTPALKDKIREVLTSQCVCMICGDKGPPHTHWMESP